MGYIDRDASIKGDYAQLLGGHHNPNRLWYPPKKRLKSVQFYGSTTKRTRERYEFAFGADPQIREAASPSLHIQPGKSISPFLLVYTGERRDSKEQALMIAFVLEGSGYGVQVYHAEDKILHNLPRV